MCDMCDCRSSDESVRKALRDRAELFARRLESLAEMHRAMSVGGIDPHKPSPQLSAYALNAKQIIRELVQEWV